MQKYKHWDVTSKIIDASMEVHRVLGADYQEIIYHNALFLALKARGLVFNKEKEFKIIFNNTIVGIHNLDLVVADKVVVELKAVTGEMPDISGAQVISYLKASKLEIALLINFGNESLDVKRLVRFHDYHSTRINRIKHGIYTDLNG
ncbi:MAG: GxxExxY protein [Patescibacteria group bacterium]